MRRIKQEMRKLGLKFCCLVGWLWLAAAAAHGGTYDVQLKLSWGVDHGDTNLSVIVAGQAIIIPPSYDTSTNWLQLRANQPLPVQVIITDDLYIFWSEFVFQNLPRCAQLIVDGTATYNVNADGTVVHTVYDHLSSNSPQPVFTFRINPPAAPEVRFDACQTAGFYYIPADGLSTARAFLTATNANETSWSPVTWTISSSDNLGCSIDPTNGLIRAGTRPGVIRVRATNGDGCFVEEDLELLFCGAICSKSGDVIAILKCVQASISLGQAGYGKNMGSLTIYSTNLTSELYTPASLAYTYRRDLQVIRPADGPLRQLCSTDTLVNIVSNSATAYQIQFYPVAAITNTSFEDGVQIYEMDTNRCFRRLKVGNPDASGSSRLSIADCKPTINGDVTNSVILYACTNNVWTLTTGDGTRHEHKTSSWSAPVETVTREILDDSSVVLSASGQKFETNALGRFLTEETWGSGSGTLTNRYVYNSTTGDLEQFYRHDGYWEWKMFDTQHRPVAMFTAFQNAAPNTNAPNTCRVFEYSYSNAADNGAYSPSTPRLVIEKLLGTEISRRYAIVKEGERVEILCPNPGLAISNNLNLTTVTRFYTNGLFKDEIQSVQHANGTLTLCEYSQGGAYRTNTITTGQPGTAGTNIVDGTRVVTILGTAGQVLSQTTTDIGTGLLLDQVTYAGFDEYGRPGAIFYLDGTSNSISYACCGPESVTSREGITTAYEYNSLKQPFSVIVNGISRFNTWDAVGNLREVVRRGTNDNDLTLFTALYDNAGRLRTNRNALNLETRFDESGVPRVQTITRPDNSQQELTWFRDGTLATNKGNATFPVRYESGTVTDANQEREYLREIKLDANGGDTNEKTTYLFDGVGRVYRVEKAAATGPAVWQAVFNTKGQLERVSDPDGVTTIYEYNGLGERHLKAVKRDTASIITWTVDDITKVEREIVTDAQNNVLLRFKTYAWTEEGSTASNLVAQTDLRAGGLQQVVTVLDGGNSRSVTNTVSINAATQTRYLFQTGSDGSAITNTYQNGRLLSSYRYAGGDCVGGETYAYDAHGRSFTVTDVRTGTVTTNLYNSDDSLNNSTVKATGLTAQSLGIEYDDLGYPKRLALPDGLAVTNVYSPTGLLRTNWGARTYPAAFGYDPQGRLTNLTTWTNLTLDTGQATTSWSRDSYSGLATGKSYLGTNGLTHTFTLAGRPKTRTTSRNITTTYSTNHAGQVSAIDYSDSTPDLSFTYSRQGQVKTVSTNGTTAATLAYNSLGQLVSEIQGGLTLTNAYNSLLQLESVGVTRDNTNLVSSSYEYDGSSRLKTVSFCSHTVTYSYWPNSSLISNVVFREGSTTRLTTSRTYDNLNRLTSITSVPSASSAVEFRYGYNQANQRTAVTNADSSRWEFQYDSLGQLTNAAKKWADGTLVAGQQFAYIFDDIGNRRLAIRDAREGANTITLLNQITDRNNPGYINIIGEATNTATVTVNYQRADRKDAYFRKELAVNNANGPVWQGVTNIAVLNQGTNADLIATNLGSLYVPPGTETLQYDADGNLTNDGHWSYTWDAENRLVGQETTTSAVSAGVPKQKLDNAYDWRWRRTQKTVSAWSGSAWTNAYQRKFAYSDWNLVAELDGNGALQRSHVWGLDASGTFQGAGGVGGLLATVFHTGANAGTYFPVYNGNHCIVAYVSAATGATVAEYEYGPFHELLRATGPMAREFNLLASTKYYDWETGLYYYGYRYYSPELARWLSRDPLGELGGYGLYSFVKNAPIGAVDSLGLSNQPGDFGWGWFSIVLNNPALLEALRPPTQNPDPRPSFAANLFCNCQKSGCHPCLRRGNIPLAQFRRQTEILTGLGAPQWIGTPMGSKFVDMNTEAWVLIPAAELAAAKLTLATRITLIKTTGDGALSWNEARLIEALTTGLEANSISLDSVAAARQAYNQAIGCSRVAAETTAARATQLEFNFAKDFGQNSGLVIGRGADLSAPGALGAGEYKLGWFSVQSTSGMEAEWAVNQAKLQNVMNLNLPIRDASSLLDTGGFYLNRERGMLQSAGWNYQGGFWVPPAH